MEPARFQAIAQRYSGLRIAVVGDFCLDRYLEIDPSKGEVSIETGLPVYNVVNVRAQPGGAGPQGGGESRAQGDVIDAEVVEEEKK